MNKNQIIKKQEGIKTIRFPITTKVIEINAALAVEQVTIQIMNAIKPLFMNLN